MKNLYKYFIVAVLAIAAGGFLWWKFNKKAVVRNEIEKAVARGTDSTYYIKYDSSHIDETGGNAVFYNMVLQSDSLQEKLYTDDTSDIAKTIINVHIEKLAITGANIPSFLRKNKVEADLIEIVRPVITLINTGKEEEVKFTAEDTLALYEKITGKFNSIQAKEIRITDGTIAFARGKKSPHTTLQGVNATLKNLKIDSTRNYNNLLSYFIKDVVATVSTANVKNEKGQRLLRFEGVEYNAPGRFVKVNKFSQTDLTNNEDLISLSNSRVSGISTDAFIKNRQLKADSLTTAGGILGFYRSKKDKTESIDIDNEFFDKALIKNIRVGPTTVSLYDKANKNTAPQVLRNVKFNASGISGVYSGTDILQLIGNSKWDLSADGFSFITGDKLYKIDIGPFILNKALSAISVKYAAVIPLLSEEAFVRTLKVQKDRFDLRLNDIRFTGADVERFINNKKIIAEQASFQPVFRIFNDRTVPPATASKVGEYPHQLLKKFKTELYLKTVSITNGNIHYVERGALSKQTGNVYFNNVNMVISNVTNIPDYIQKNNSMNVSLTAKFLDMADISSVWNLPLDTQNGTFSMSGKVGAFDGTNLNPVIEPLGMGSVIGGRINSYTFNMRGTDLNATGEAVMLYEGLKIKLLKNSGNIIEKKGVTSLVANLFIKDKNPSGGKTRKGNMAFQRVIPKSFFNLVWKSIFAGAQTSIK